MGKVMFGWWTTGRDQAAIDLFQEVQRAIEQGVIPGQIGYCFFSREPGESQTSDRLMDIVKTHGIPVIYLSAVRFEPELRARDRETWRKLYHKKVLELVENWDVELVVLAGYMWVVSPEVCERLRVINLHPAAPGGPAGTWQEVIWQLLETDAQETGVMMHLVTPELDKGPAVTYCTFSIKGPRWEGLWRQFKEQMSVLGLKGVKERYGEEQPLFKAIRQEGVKRELPLIVQTLKTFAMGRITIKNGRLLDKTGKSLKGPYDLSEQIESYLGQAESLSSLSRINQ